jgi:hypothetical protein
MARTRSKCFKNVGAGISGLRRVREFVPLTTLLTIYNSLIQPLFDYCDVVWDSLPAAGASILQKLQNRAARVITYQGYDVRSNEIRSNNHIRKGAIITSSASTILDITS